MGIRSFLARLKAILAGRQVVTASGQSNQAVPLHEQRYADGVRFFEQERLSEALDAFADFLRMTHQSAIFASASPLFGLENVRSYSDFEREFASFLDQRSREWEEYQRPFPRYLAMLATEQLPGTRVQGKRILFLMPQYIMNSRRFIEADFKDHLLESAANAGAEVDIFPTDRCSYPGDGFDADVAKTELDILSTRVAAFAPDVIVLDGNYVPSKDSLNPEYLKGLQAKRSFKVIVFIGDAWGSHWVPAADSWSEVADIVFHFAPGTPIEKEGKFPEKLCWSAYPVNERNFFPDHSKKLDISFVGTYVSVLRPFWLTVALQIAQELGLKHRLLPHKREAGVALTMDEYAAVLRQSKMVLNFSTRLGPLKTMTGRTWQAFSSGVVLLEEENTFTSAYFVPFVHYVPFSNRNELAYAIKFFSLNPDSARRIGNAATSFCRERYASSAIWSRLLAAAHSRSEERQGLSRS